MTDFILSVQDLSKIFPITEGLFRRVVGEVRALDGVSLDIRGGETVALVGESGSGKTTFGKTILRISEPTRGAVRFKGGDLLSLSEKELLQTRRRMQMIFQDPTSSLNPRKRVSDIIAEPLDIHGVMRRGERSRWVRDLLDKVELPEEFLNRYPHSLSGGQKQRVGIARALALQPELIVLDEPTSALDVSVQAKIMSLLQSLQRELGLTYLFISHDLRLVKNIADRVAVMYLGKIVELAPTEELFHNPRHPYTLGLLSCIPTITEEEEELKHERISMEGEIPSPSAIPPGCSFHTRCSMRMDVCDRKSVELIPLNDQHWVRCHMYDGSTGSAQAKGTALPLRHAPERQEEKGHPSD